ncbi:MAG TPA: cytochrome ubiquinol oxidase subunit I [Solirubrobacteraceae bacterium]|nr:cytochrome ubiquinol oxidase subunit I [Solirubrobacteraceae bacterium]
MNALELARLQFGVTTLFHFIFVPVTIGLTAWTAYCQTRWYRSTDEEVWLRATRFWGKLMLISLAIGVVTGIVQEFQFGMNWSQYSRYVGDIFGAPLAMEGLAAFFLESTFVGLWIFGWNRLSPKLHLATIWLTAFGTALSAFFILAANSWMQHPVGYRLNATTHHAELTSIWKVLTNSTVLLAFPHTVLGAFTTAGMLVLGICALGMLRARGAGSVPGSDVYARSMRAVLPMTLVAAIATGAFGHAQGTLMEKQQPMKMAAAEALYETKKGASLSIFAVGPFERHPARLNTDLRIPHLLSIIGTASWNGEVKGINQINREEQAKYGPGDYVPIVGVTYWTFRLMSGAGVLLVLIPLLGLLLLRRGGVERRRWFLRAAVAGIFLPPLANLTGWIFTEMGRQPWVVFGLLKTSDARSPLVGSGQILLTLVGYTLIYGTLLVIGGRLFLKDVAHGPEEPGHDGAPPEQAPREELILAY